MRFSHDFHVVGRVWKELPQAREPCEGEIRGRSGVGRQGTARRCKGVVSDSQFFLDLTCPVPRLRRADLLAAPRFGVAFLSLFVGRLQGDPIRATGDSLAGHLCGLVSTRPLSSVSGLVLDLKVVFSRFPVPGFVLTSRHTARTFAASVVMAINAN